VGCRLNGNTLRRKAFTGGPEERRVTTDFKDETRTIRALYWCLVAPAQKPSLRFSVPPLKAFKISSNHENSFITLINTNLDAEGITAISQWLSAATPLD
jgi:hypothetical protein